MILDRSWDITLDDLAERPVRAARMMAELRGPGRTAVVVLDADSDAFALVPGLAPDVCRNSFSLSFDGTALVYLTPGPHGRTPVVRSLSSGEERVVPHGREDDEITCAVLSPDGVRLAAAVDLRSGSDDADENQVGIALIDLATGRRERIWTAEGHWDEPQLSWSAGGLLAGTFLAPGDVLTTVVLEPDGTVLADLPEHAVVPSAHSAWLGDRRPLTFADPDDAGPLVSLDLDTGAEHRFSRPGDVGYLAVHDGLLVQTPQYRHGSHTLLTVSTLDGEAPRPFLTITPAIGIESLDFTPPLP